MTCKACYGVKPNFQQYNVCQNYLDIRDTCKFRKMRHQYPEFGRAHGEIKKTLAKKYISIQGGGRGTNTENHEF
jgi:hypothetical protein